MTKIWSPKNESDFKRLSALTRQGSMRRIHQGIYTDDLETPLSELVLREWMEIVPHIIPGGILSFRTAQVLKPVPFHDRHILFMTSTYSKTIEVHGLIIKVVKGNVENGIERVTLNLTRSNIARRCLENLSTVRKSDLQGIKTIGEVAVEDLLAKELLQRKEKSLNQIREEARELAELMGYWLPFKKLNKIISALLSTYEKSGGLSSEFAKAVANREPFDSQRLDLFQALADYLQSCHFIERRYEYSLASFQNIAFFESYFSNYIEGTEFEIDEAEDIVFRGKEIQNRHADSHDVLSHFVISNDYSDMITTPQNPEQWITLLKNRHAYFLRERPDKSPGQFKKISNRAGATSFVSPEFVEGTLTRAFDIYRKLNPGMEKALFMHYLIAEVHPFVDGNGRISRIMLNAELSAAGLFKCIMPSVHRDSYLNGLRLASRHHEFRIYCKVLDQAQAYTMSIDWQDYGEARSKLETDCATYHPDEGLPLFNRVLRELALSEFAP